MIIWINGSFGSGKTSVAQALNKLIDKSAVYDPEEVGQFIRANVFDGDAYSDFQDHPLWTDLNYRSLKYMAQKQDTCIIVPMTLVNDEYYNAIVRRLRANNVEVEMFTLLASKTILHSRLLARGDEAGSWAFNQLDRCIRVLNHERFGTHINSEQYNVNEIARLIYETI